MTEPARSAGRSPSNASPSEERHRPALPEPSERVRLLAEHGLKACIGNFSIGNPDLPLWPGFFPAIDAVRAHGGILGIHEYGTPMQQYFDDAAGEGWLCGRDRKLYRQYLNCVFWGFRAPPKARASQATRRPTPTSHSMRIRSTARRR